MTVAYSAVLSPPPDFLWIYLTDMFQVMNLIVILVKDNPSKGSF